MSKTLISAKKFVAELALKRRLVSLFRTLRNDDWPIPYAVTYAVALDFFFPKDFEIADFRGLLFCHIVKGEGVNKLISYWLDKESFHVFADRFDRTLGLAAPESRGSAIEIKRPEKPWWKPREHFSAREWVLAIFALLGAGLGLRDYAAVLFAIPDVSVVYPDAEHTNAVVGQEFTIPLSLSSEVRFAPMIVRLHSAWIQPRLGGSVVELSLHPQILPNLTAAQSQSITLSGSAPQRNPASSAPDIYDLTVAGDSKAGIISAIILGRRRLPVPKRQLWVWPAKPQSPHPTFSRAASNICELDGVIYVSKAYPQGLPAAFTLAAPAGRVSQMYISGGANSEEEHLRSDTGSGSILKNEYQTPPLDKFQTYRYSATIYLTTQATQSECESLASNLTTSLQYP
jgi:hypothetical protein